MEKFTESKANKFYFLIWGFLITSIIIMYHNSQKIISDFFTYKYQISRSGNEWKYETTDVGPGLLFLSLGRPRGNCRLEENGVVLDSMENSNSGYRRDFSLGGSLYLKERRRLSGIIKCELAEGFASGLSDKLLIANYKTGVVLHFWRIFNEVVFGPISSILLFTFAFFLSAFNLNSKKIPKTIGVDPKNFPYISFALISLLYSISLSHLTRIVLIDFNASSTHIVLRILFSYSLIHLFVKHTGYKKLNIFIHTILLILMLGAINFDKEHLEDGYDSIVPIFSFVTAFYFALMLRVHSMTKEVVYLRYLAIVWTISQLMDLTAVYTGFGSYSAPSVIFATSVIVFLIILNNHRFETKKQNLNDKIVRLINLKLPFDIMLTDIADLLCEFTSFNRVSCYIDGVVRGDCEVEQQKLYRIMNRGYEKDTEMDEILVIEEGQGMKMISSSQMDEGLYISQNNNDFNWYMIIRIDKYLFINLSTSKNVSMSEIIESKVLIDNSLSSLSLLRNEVEKRRELDKIGLERLRLSYPMGTTEGYFFYLFADISNYSKQLKIGGFKDFLENQYFSALFDFVSHKFYGEIREGDDIFLIAEIKDKIEIEDCLDLFNSFVLDHGARLCLENGFDPILFKITVGHSKCSVLITKQYVGVVGDDINMTSRIRDLSTDSKIPILASSANNIEFIKYKLSNQFEVIRKKDYLCVKYLSKKAA